MTSSKSKLLRLKKSAPGEIILEPRRLADYAGDKWFAAHQPDCGRVSTAMEVFPVTADTIQPPNLAPHLESPVYFAHAGTYDVYKSPTLDVIPTRALALAVPIDDPPPQVVNVFTPATFKSEDFPGQKFNKNTRNNARVLRFKQTVSTPGKHTLKIHMIDPTVVVMKVVFHPRTDSCRCQLAASVHRKVFVTATYKFQIIYF